jgi:hypothetical protein
MNYQLLGLTLLIGAAREMTPQALASDRVLSTQNRFSLLPAHTCVCSPFALRSDSSPTMRLDFLNGRECKKIRRRPSKISEQIGSFHFLQARGVGK